MSKKVFSKEKFCEVMHDRATHWVEVCDGLTEEEMKELGYATSNDWMVEVEDD
jgi:hypothetical protein